MLDKQVDKIQVVTCRGKKKKRGYYNLGTHKNKTRY